MSKERIKVGIIGVGNCAKSLVEGISYYRGKDGVDGIMNPNIGDYLPGDIEVVIGFDIDSRKINKNICRSIYEKPNCAIDLHKVEPDEFSGNVYRTSVIDGYSEHFDNYPEEDRPIVKWEDERIEKKDILKLLKENDVDILINYLPVGSQKATEYWAEICLESGISFLNCIPVFIASDPVWEQKFIDAKIPLIGDDMRSEFGASILSQVLQELAFARGHKVKAHIQRNVGGNTDFLNMENKDRLKSKKISKENVIRAQNIIRGIPTEDSFLHAGPSEYIKYYGDNKVANFRLELEGFMGSPVILDAQLSVQDSPNSAGVVIDAIRYLKVAREMGVVGSLRGPSAFTQKTPPEQMMLQDAMYECDELANRRLTVSTSKNLK